MRLICFFTLTLLANISAAGHFNNAIISSVVVDSYGVARVTLNSFSQVEPPPGCTVNATKLTYDVNGTSGSAWHSMVLSAQARQAKVHIIGKNTCLALNGSLYEEVGTIYTLSQ